MKTMSFYFYCLCCYLSAYVFWVNIELFDFFIDPTVINKLNNFA